MWLGEPNINAIVKTHSPLPQYIYDVNCIGNFEAEKIMQISLDKKSFRNMPLATQDFACDVHGNEYQWPMVVLNSIPGGSYMVCTLKGLMVKNMCFLFGGHRFKP